jgi:hypothetical protein
MAFCPNCGTPNTEQAERCVACGFELIVPKQKAKFKGTIMMSGIKAPASLAEAAVPEPAPPQPASSAPASLPPAPSRNPNYQKTMLGQAPVVLPKPEATPASVPPADLGTMPTMQGASPLRSTSPLHQGASTLQPSPQPSLPPASYAGNSTPNLAATNPLGSLPRSTAAPMPGQSAHGGFTPPSPSGGAGYGGCAFANGATVDVARPSLGGTHDSTVPPAAGPNPAKVIAVGCGVVLALMLIVGGALWFAFGDRIRGLFGGASVASAAEAAAWHASIGQSLTKVNELCATDCAQAGVFFHPLKQAALLGEARALTPARVAKLNDPATASAMMLDHTDEGAVATQLGLDPQQCARVTTGGAKVISCSVPDATGKPSVLRIVQLSGVDTL